jgi:poly(3-hydroxyalkanoate) synthetase
LIQSNQFLLKHHLRNLTRGLYGTRIKENIIIEYLQNCLQYNDMIVKKWAVLCLLELLTQDIFFLDKVWDLLHKCSIIFIYNYFNNFILIV